MHPDELIEALRTEGEALASVAADHLDTTVPSCPGWDVATLVNHLGRVHRWAIEAIRTQSKDSPPFPKRPENPDVAWFRSGVAELADLLAETDPDTKMWTFPGGGGSARFWIRRQAEETALHRWDAERATTSAPRPLETELALAGIDEVFDVYLAPRNVQLGGSVHFHATDSPHGEWNIANGADGGLLIGHGHEKADVALKGTASDLLLWLWGRPVPESGLEVFGDEAVLDRWRAGLSMG